MTGPELHSVVEQLRAAYIASLTDKLAALKAAVSVRQFKDVVQHGHQLKGSGRSYGFPEVSDLGERIEDAGQTHQGALLDALMVEFERLVKRLTGDSTTVKA